MSLTRRELIKGTAAALAASTLGARFSAASGIQPHFMVLITLRGGFDSLMSVAPKDQQTVGDNIDCGYSRDEMVRGEHRLFGPLIGGLERHDRELCLIHGVRSDTTSHADGLAMLMRGGTKSRAGRIDHLLAKRLVGDAALEHLDLSSPDGNLPFHEAPRPAWAELRAAEHGRQIDALADDKSKTKSFHGARRTMTELERFLGSARRNSTALDAQFSSSLGPHLRLAFQAIAGNWARCTFIASRAAWFDSHSDHVRFQTARQPETLGDLARFIDLLKSTRNDYGSLFDQTTIAVYSEFGRFPRLNGQRGKDHWPENSWILAGKGVNGGTTIGAIDQFGKGQRVNFGSGKVDTKDGRAIFLDNTFATLAAIAGGDATTAGYDRESVLGCALA